MINNKYFNKYNKYRKKQIKLNGVISGGSLFYFDWFECAFGFRETSYNEMQKNLNKLYCDSNLERLHP